MSMQRLIAFAIGVLFIASCSKETDLPEVTTCHDTVLAGEYSNVEGTYGTGSVNVPVFYPLTDAQKNLKVKSLDCNQVQIFFADNVNFVAGCTASNTGEISGANSDGSGEYTYNPSTKKLNIRYTDATGASYLLSGTN
ncbi:MAG: hypothetical protein ACK5SQ_11890 [Chitinophagales bacterium]